MPSNLNALVRYKTINSCLHGGRRKWSIRELIEACSEALADTRGRYSPISERTIRDDLRVMRSDILGFYAPIEQDKGLYYYSDPRFSILSLKITDEGLADKIYTFLLQLRTELQHPELESILEQLCDLTDKTYESPVLAGNDNIKEAREVMHSRDICEKSMSEFCLVVNKPISTRFSARPIKRKELSWGEVFKRITP